MSLAPLQFLLLLFAGWLNQCQHLAIEYLREENRILRAKLPQKHLRFTDKERKRLARKGKALGRKALRELTTLVHPDTVLRWYRQLVAKKYDGSKKRGPGRPRKPEELRQLVVRVALANRSWGYTRIRGALKNLGCTIGRTTIARILDDEGLPPETSKGPDWKTFLKAHWGHIAAMDFFTVEVLRPWGLVRYHVLFIIDLATRKVEVCGIVHEPSGKWVEQMGRNLTDALDGFLRDARYLIVDRDPLFTKRFQGILGSTGVEVIRLPARSPNLNAYAERFVRSVRQECLSKIIPLSERHLRWALTEYLDHYHAERNHQGLDNKLIVPSIGPREGSIHCRKRVGGLLKY